LSESEIQIIKPLRILHIAPFNTAGVPLALVTAERTLGYHSRLITLHKHIFDYQEDICLDLPIISFPGSLFLKNLIKSNFSEYPQQKDLPMLKKYSLLEKPLFKIRDQAKITARIATARTGT